MFSSTVVFQYLLISLTVSQPPYDNEVPWNAIPVNFGDVVSTDIHTAGVGLWYRITASHLIVEDLDCDSAHDSNSEIYVTTDPFDFPNSFELISFNEDWCYWGTYNVVGTVCDADPREFYIRIGGWSSSTGVWSIQFDGSVSDEEAILNVGIENAGTETCGAYYLPSTNSITLTSNINRDPNDFNYKWLQNGIEIVSNNTEYEFVPTENAIYQLQLTSKPSGWSCNISSDTIFIYGVNAPETSCSITSTVRVPVDHDSSSSSEKTYVLQNKSELGVTVCINGSNEKCIKMDELETVAQKDGTFIGSCCQQSIEESVCQLLTLVNQKDTEQEETGGIMTGAHTVAGNEENTIQKSYESVGSKYKSHESDKYLITVDGETQINLFFMGLVVFVIVFVTVLMFCFRQNKALCC